MRFFLNIFRKYFLKRHCRKIMKAIESGLLDAFLETLLKAMCLLFLIDKSYRKNIEGFNARYAFVSREREIAASAIFKNNKLKIVHEEIKDTNVTVVFKDSKVLMEFLFDRNPDIMNAVLNNDVTYDGNLNYLSKFAYMAKHLQLEFSL